MGNIVCKKCKENKDFRYEEKGPHLGVYCNKCNSWIKWTSKGSKVVEVNTDSKGYELVDGVDTITCNVYDDIPW